MENQLGESTTDYHWTYSGNLLPESDAGDWCGMVHLEALQYDEN